MSNERDSRARLVDLPNVEPLVLVKTLVKLVWHVSLGQDTLTSISELDGIGVRHFTNDTIDSINGPHTPVEYIQVWIKKQNKNMLCYSQES